jgi:hypothetical protein
MTAGRNLMTTTQWSAWALFGCVALAGCYGSKPQVKDGQSHWMAVCRDDADCPGELLCACGVCTIACDDDVACGPHGACEGLADRSACEGSTSSATDVCLETCVRDPDCFGPGLECVDHACVAAEVHPPMIEPEPGAIVALPVGETFEIGALAVTDDAVFWQDLGTTDANGEHLGNGGVYRFDLETQEVTAIASALHVPLRGLWVDDERAYVADASGILYFALDGGGSGGVANVASGRVAAPWTVADGSIYYAPARGQAIRRMTPATGEDRVVLDVGADLAVLALASDGESVFIEAHRIGLPATALLAIDEDNAWMTVVTNSFRITNTDGKFVVNDGLVFSVEGNRTVLRVLEIATHSWSDLREIESPSMALRSVADSFVYYTLDQSFENGGLGYSLLRSRLAQEPEVMRSSLDAIGDVIEKNRELYWIEGNRILRKRL